MFLLKYVAITIVPTATVATITITTVKNITTVTITNVTFNAVTINYLVNFTKKKIVTKGTAYTVRPWIF